MILKKKILSSWAILSLSMIPILTIATRSSGTPTRTSVVSSTTIPKVGHWQKAAGSKLTSGERGKFFQARNGDLYVMGKGTGLEVLKQGELAFKPAPSSITTNGEFGTIFQARNGDIYVMGNGTRLEVLKDGEEEFQVVSSSNIDDGKEGTIFQTKNGDIYTMGISRKLQVLKNDATSFIDAPGSMITSGYESHFFESQSGDLYVAGWKTGLEVLKSGDSAFTKASGSTITNGAGMRFLEAQNSDIYVLHEKGLDVLKNGASNFIPAPSSITTNGAFGTIFQTSSGDIYVMGHNTKLEVLKNGATDFTLAHGSRVNNGRDGRIFEARNGDLYVMGKGTGLEVLKKGTSTFIGAPGSKIQNGSYGWFFQASNSDLYVISQYSTLEVLKYGADSFQRARGSKIVTGLFAKIFQAQNGDIYTMGYKAPLQVLKKGEDKFKIALGSNIKNGRLGRFFQAKNGDIYAMGESDLEVLKGEQLEFALTREASAGQNDGQIALTNYRNQFSKLQYRKEGTTTWNDVPSNGIIDNISPGLYEFQWVAKGGFQYGESNTSTGVVNEKQLIASAEVIDVPNLPTFTSTKETTSDANDGSITVTTFANADSQLQYRQTLIKDVWKDVPSSGQINDLSPGEYAFRWKSKNYQYYKGTKSTLAIIEKKQMVVSADATNIPISPTFHKTDETIKGLNDGKIIVRNLLQKYPGLSFKVKRGESDSDGYYFDDVNPNGIIENLKIFSKYYWFPVKSKMSYVSPSNPQVFLNKDEIEHIFKPRLIDIEYDDDQNPKKYKVILKTYFEENDHWLQYKETNSSKWKNVPGSGIIDNLSFGTYYFRWKSKKMHTYEGTSQPTKLIKNSLTILEGTNILVPSLPNFQVTSEATSGGNDGIITITNFINAHSKLQYRSEGTLTWADVPPNGIINSLSPGDYEFQWTSKDDYLYDENSSNTYALKKQVVLSYARKTVLETAKRGFNNFKQTLNSLPNHLPNGNVQEGTLASLPGHRNMPPLDAGITRSFKIYTNQKTGIANVIVSFRSGSGSSQVLDQVFYTISGFKNQKLANDKIAVKTMVQGLRNIDLNTLIDTSILPDAITATSVFEAIKKVQAFIELTNDQKALFNLEDISLNGNSRNGTLAITIANHGENKVISLSGFKNQKQANDETAVQTMVQGLRNIDLNTLIDTSILPDAITATSVFEAIKKVQAFIELTNDQKALFKLEDISLNGNSRNGTLAITIANHGENKVINLSGFKNQKQANDETAVQTMVQGLRNIDLNTLIDASILPDAITATSVFEAIKKVQAFTELTNDQKALFKLEDISLNGNSRNGTLAITIANHGENKVINLSGFKNQKQADDETAVQTMVQGLKNTDLVALVDRNILPDKIIVTSVFEEIKKVQAFTELTSDQQVLLKTNHITLNPNNSSGELTININSYEEKNSILLIGFKTTAKKLAEGAIARDKTNLSNFGNQNVIDMPDPLAGGFTDKATLETLAGHNAIPKPIVGVTRAYRISTDLATGIATITIDLTSGESPNQVFDTFIYTISGFKTQAQINANLLKIAIQVLNASSLNGKGDSLKLPSEIEKATVLSWIKALSSINDLADDVKDLLDEDDIMLAFNDEEGILTITINNHGTQKTFNEISGFRIQTNSEALELVVQALDVNGLSRKGDSSKLPSEVKKATVLSWIKALSTINDLVKDVKDLLLEDNIMLSSNDEEGSLIITINSHGDPKTFSKIIGFKTNAKKVNEDAVNADKALFSDFDQTLTGSVEPLDDGVVIDLTPLTSNGHQAMPPQTSAVTREFKIARAATGIATMTVTFKAGASLNQVSDTITYKINGFKVITFQDFSSSTTYSSLAKNLKTFTSEILEKDVKTEFEKINDYATYNNVDSTVILSKVEVVASDEIQRQVTYKITFNIDGSEQKEKDIIVTFALDLDADAKKFKDFISSAKYSELQSNAIATSGETPPNVQADFIKIPGYAKPANLSVDVTIKSVIVKNPYNASNRQVVYTLTITNGKEDKSFDLNVTFKPDFALERAKFKNFDSRLGTYAEIAIAPKNGNDVKALFEKIDGYAIPENLATGVKIYQVVVKEELNTITRQVIYSIKLWDGKNIDTSEHGIIVTFAKDLDAGAHQLVNFASSDNVQSVAALLMQNNEDVKATFEAINGYTKPMLTGGVAINKVIVKKALDATNREVAFTITLAKTNQNDASATPTTKTKDVIVTFAPSLDEEAKKFKDFVSSDNVKSKAALLKQNSDDIKTTFEAISGYTKPVLTSGVQISKAIVKKALSDSRVIFTITLTYESIRKTKDVTVTFKKVSIAKSEGLSNGAIVGIAIGSIASLGILGYLIYYLMKRK